jgi:hypothetical protein
MKEKNEQIIEAEIIQKPTKDFVLQFNGGIGKAIMATSFIKWLKEKYPDQKITIISPWPEIFEYSPHIYRNLPMHQAYLFEDYIKGKDFRSGEPYSLEEYYREENKMHCMELYPKSFGFHEYNEKPVAELFLTPGEKKDAENFKIQGSPAFTIQISGGVPQGAPQGVQKDDMAQRDLQLQIGTYIATHLIQRGFRVVQIAQQGEPQIPLPQVIRFNLPFRRMACLSPVIAGHIGIDSSMMHASAVFKTPQLIFFEQTHKDNLGYDYEGFFHVSKPEGMYCRPHVALPDNGGIYPYRDPKELKAAEWTNEEIQKSLDEFLHYVFKERLPKLYPNVNFGGQK